MSHKSDFVRMITIIILTTFISCKKENVTKSDPMPNNEQIYYTQEGHPYILRTITSSTFNTVFAAQPPSAIIAVNNTPAEKAAIIGNKTVIFLETNKKIIPISYSFSAVVAGNGPVGADIQSCYYYVTTVANASPYTKYKGPLSKAIPYVQRIYYTSDVFYGYNIMYDSLLFSDKDFLETNQSLYVFFRGNLAEVMSGQLIAAGQSTLTGTYYVGITFTYFEMVN